MDTKVIVIDKDDINDIYIEEAAEVIKDGGLVAFPTETVYGLGGNALDKDASHKIYSAKGRPSDNPLIVHIAEFEALDRIVKDIPEAAKKLADAFWPGPLTIVFNKTEAVPYETTGGLETVAVRMPEHKIALELIKKSGGYIAAPSANTSGRPSPTLASHVEEDLSGRIEMIIDGGEVGIGIESTIVDLTTDTPVILRPGFITDKMIKDVLGSVETDKAIMKEHASEGLKPKAPGMMYRHYAPKAELILVEGENSSVVDKINELVSQDMDNNIKVGVIATSENVDMYQCDTVKVIGSRDDELSISQGLYRILREFDDSDVERIYTESFMEEGFKVAIMNRLLKAAGYKTIKV